MDSTTIIQSLGTVLDPIVLGGAAVVTIAFLTGAVARFVELVEHLDILVVGAGFAGIFAAQVR